MAFLKIQYSSPRTSKHQPQKALPSPIFRKGELHFISVSKWVCTSDNGTDGLLKKVYDPLLLELKLGLVIHLLNGTTTTIGAMPTRRFDPIGTLCDQFPKKRLFPPSRFCEHLFSWKGPCNFNFPISKSPPFFGELTNFIEALFGRSILDHRDKFTPKWG